MTIDMGKLPTECKALLDCIDIINASNKETVGEINIELNRDAKVIDRYLETETARETPNQSLIDRLLDNRQRITRSTEFLKTHFKDTE